MHKRIQLLQDYLTEAACRLPDKVALVHQQRRMTFAELELQSNTLAHSIVERGVKRGDRVLVFLDNSLEAAISFFGVLKANAVVVMVNPLTKADKLAAIARDSGAKCLVTGGHMAATFAPVAQGCSSLEAIVVTGALASDRAGGQGVDWVRRMVSWDDAISGDRAEPPDRRNLDIDLAALIYTSGTTGEPKGVMLTHRNMLTAANSIASYLGNNESDVILGALPMAFTYGIYQLITACAVGARLVIERSFAFPAQVLNTIAAERVTGFPGVPTIFTVLGGFKQIERFDLSSVRYVTNAAAALSTKHIDIIRRVFPTAETFSMYGQTECGRGTYLPPSALARKPTSIGIAIPNTELWLVNDKDERVGAGETGQLVIRGATVMRGYWRKPEQTAMKLRPGPLPGEVVLYTGDDCQMDEEGYLYFVSRMDDIIKSAGEKVPPKEVEHAIFNLQGVKEVAVIGVPDPILGQAVKAFVVLEQDVQKTEREIIAQCQRVLENFMVPKFVEFRSELPKNANGKVTKSALA